MLTPNEVIAIKYTSLTNKSLLLIIEKMNESKYGFHKFQ